MDVITIGDAMVSLNPESKATVRVNIRTKSRRGGAKCSDWVFEVRVKDEMD